MCWDRADSTWAWRRFRPRSGSLRCTAPRGARAWAPRIKDPIGRWWGGVPFGAGVRKPARGMVKMRVFACGGKALRQRELSRPVGPQKKENARRSDALDENDAFECDGGAGQRDDRGVQLRPTGR